MNQFYAHQFAQNAQAAGVPVEKVAALLKRASEITTRRGAIKTAGAEIVNRLIGSAGMNKTASSVAYTHGLLKEAFDNGATLPQAYTFTKQALAETNARLTFMSKVAEIQNSPELSQYAEGFMGRAKLAGMSETDALNLVINVIDNEKRADDAGMFKQPSAPDSDPAAGAPPGGPGGPGGPAGPTGPGADQEAQLMQVLQSLPPEEQQQIVQQILAAISGGQGGPGGPGGPPPGAGGPPPSGAGGPPPGGPQGPA